MELMLRLIRACKGFCVSEREIVRESKVVKKLV
jgi:hypothetical protein